MTIYNMIKTIYNKAKNDFILLKYDVGNISYNCTGIPNYENLTVDNFFCEFVTCNSNWHGSGDRGDMGVSIKLNKSYDPSTGILTISGMSQDSPIGAGNINVSGKVNVYLKVNN